MNKSLSLEDANRLLTAFSDAAKRLIGRRTLLESHLFPVTTYVATGLYNLYEIGYDSLKQITKQASPEEIGRLGRRPMSRINQKTHFSIVLGYLVGREQRLMDQDPNSMKSDEDSEHVWFVLDFFRRVVSAYRNDGHLFVADGAGTIPILPSETLSDLRELTFQIDEARRGKLRRMLALLQSYLFLSNCESRGNVFSHGPYGEDHLVVREFTSLKSGPLADYLEASPPVDHLAVLLDLQGMRATLDEVGTLYVEPPDYIDYIKRIGLVTVNGSDAEPISPSVIDELAEFALNAQKELFYKVAEWDEHRKVVAGALQYSNLSPYYEAIGAAGSFTPHLGQRCRDIYLPKMLSTRIHPFFNRFGERPHLFTPIETSGS